MTCVTKQNLRGVESPVRSRHAAFAELCPDVVEALRAAESAMTAHNLSRKVEKHACPWDFGDGFGGTLDRVRDILVKMERAS